MAVQNKTEVIISILEEWLQERANDMRDTLNERAVNKNRSQLGQSIAPTAIIVKGGSFSATIDLDDYYEFIDQGVGGIGRAAWDKYPMAKNTGKFKFKTPFVSRSMVDNIRDWNARSGQKGVTKLNMNTVAYLTAKKVKRIGINQTLFFTDTTKEKFSLQLENRLLQALGQEFEVSLLLE